MIEILTIIISIALLESISDYEKKKAKTNYCRGIQYYEDYISQEQLI